MSSFGHSGGGGGGSSAPVYKPPGIIAAGAWQHGLYPPVAEAATTALKPTFAPLDPVPYTFTISQLGIRVGTGVAASTGGVAVYTISYSASGTYSASLVYQLNAAVATTAQGLVFGDGTTGAAGSGAGTYTLDFVNNQYVVGAMVSTVTTLTTFGMKGPNKEGLLNWTDTARSSTTDWPSTFTQANAVGTTQGTAHIFEMFLANADGKNWL